MGCTHPYWSVLQVGSQHLARQFVRNGWQVHYVSAPVTPLHLPDLVACRGEVRQRFLCAGKSPSIHEDNALYSYIPVSLVAPAGVPALRHPLVTRHWHRTIISPAASRAKRIPAALPNPVDLLYIDNLSYQFLLDHVTCRKSIFRIMDHHASFPGWQGGEARRLAEKIAAKTDLTVYSARSLEPYTVSLGAARPPLHVPNGVDFEKFNRADAGPRHPALAGIPDPVILYTGMIDIRVDLPLLIQAAGTLPDVSFVLTGPVEREIATKSLPGNIHLTGPVPHTDLPQLMKAATAGIIPFDVKNHPGLIQGIRPLKLLEYMAAGLPVISAAWPEIEKMEAPVWLYHDLVSFTDLVKKAVENAASKSEGQAASFQEYAGRHDWSVVFQKMMRAVSRVHP